MGVPTDGVPTRCSASASFVEALRPEVDELRFVDCDVEKEGMKDVEAPKPRVGEASDIWTSGAEVRSGGEPRVRNDEPSRASAWAGSCNVS